MEFVLLKPHQLNNELTNDSMNCILNFPYLQLQKLRSCHKVHIKHDGTIFQIFEESLPTQPYQTYPCIFFIVQHYIYKDIMYTKTDIHLNSDLTNENLISA